MIRLELPSQEMLHRVLSYDAGTGCLTWRVRDIGLFSPSPTRSAAHVCSLWNSKHAGAPALRFRTDGGYLRGAIFGSLYYAHRVAWFMVNGDDTLDVDHINGDRSDNRIVNLRAATRPENGKNQKFHATNKSGAMGVFWVQKLKKWRAYITVDGVRCHIGYFQSFDDAVLARKTAEVRHGFHENHGRAA